MPYVAAVAVLVIVAACRSVPPPPPVAPAQASEDSVPAGPNETTPEVLHARGVGILRMVRYPIAAGDTFVTWTPKPDLYTTVRRTNATVASSLVGTDGLVGTAEATWRGGRQREVRILWTRDTTTLMKLIVRREAGVIHLAGARDTALPAPSLPWAVADEGMEDQLLPLIEAVAADTQRLRVAVYRPYWSRWDTIAVACRRAQGATLATVTAPDGERSFWSIVADGALVRITRERNPGFERRPLEMTGRVADYERVRELRER